MNTATRKCLRKIDRIGSCDCCAMDIRSESMSNTGTIPRAAISWPMMIIR